MICRALSIFLLFLLGLSMAESAWAASGSNVENRIGAAIGFSVDQSSSSGWGFLHGANAS